MPGTYADASTWTADRVLEADVCIVGSGAGGAVAACLLQKAGLRVLVVEEGGHFSRKDFDAREDHAYPNLYQEAGGRSTKDGGIAILQGKAVGGTTVVNWTTSFRTPDDVVEHWQKHHQTAALTPSRLAPHFAEVERRLGIEEILLAVANRNNRLLYDGLRAIGIPAEVTRRNVRGCRQSGYCGMGCPYDAKQSMLVTYLPDAVEAGAEVVSRLRVERLVVAGGRVVSAEGVRLGDNGRERVGRATIKARWFVSAGGAINSPALLLRSGLGGAGPGGAMLGRRTFLHPVVAVAGVYKEPVNGFFGAPQSVASRHFSNRGDKIGVFLEAAPVHPMLRALATTGFGAAHAELMKDTANTSAHIGLTIDGFHESETGGTVTLRESGAPVLDYVLPERVWEGLRFITKTLCQANLAAGALWVGTAHDPSVVIRSAADLPALDRAPYAPLRMGVFSAHVMGGCAMSDDPARGVVRSADLRHHAVENLHVIDGSVLPTSLGVNPQLTIYGLAHLHASELARAWK